MEITCPKCSKESSFNITDAICCEHCKSSFSTLRLAKKVILPAWGALVIGGAIGHNLDDFLEPNRYPLETEYGIVESCVHGVSRTNYIYQAQKKFEICTCALKQTQQTIDFKRYKNTKTEFSQTMDSSVRSCIAS